MLHNHLWGQIARPGDRFLCLACVAQRLGRDIVKSDFNPDAPVNYTEGYLPFADASPELKKRLRRYKIFRTGAS